VDHYDDAIRLVALLVKYSKTENQPILPDAKVRRIALILNFAIYGRSGCSHAETGRTIAQTVLGTSLDASVQAKTTALAGTFVANFIAAKQSERRFANSEKMGGRGVASGIPRLPPFPKVRNWAG
jgi:hypothetical protein